METVIPQITDYAGMIKKVAWKKHQQTGIELDELESRAGLIFVEAIGHFDPSKKTKFGTFFQFLLEQQIVVREKGWGKNYYPQINTDKVERWSNNTGDPARIVEFWDTVEHMGNDAKEVVKAIFAAPEEIVDGAVGRPKLMAGNIRRKLEEMGWTGMRIWETFTEIRASLVK